MRLGAHKPAVALPKWGSLVQFGHRGTEKVWHAGGEEYGKYKQQVVEMLKGGQLVVQMLAAEETISMPDGSRKATFTQETWDMVSQPSTPVTHKT